MKARITALFAVVLVALSLVAAASADVERPATVKTWDYYAGAGSVKPWNIRGWGSSWSSLRPNPWITGGIVKRW